MQCQIKREFVDAVGQGVERNRGWKIIRLWRGIERAIRKHQREFAHAQHIAAAGWQKKDIQMALFEMARRPWGIAKNRGKSKGPFFPVWVDKKDENALVPIINEPKDLVVVVAGGAGGKSMWCPTAGAQSLSVSKLIERGE